MNQEQVIDTLKNYKHLNDDSIVQAVRFIVSELSEKIYKKEKMNRDKDGIFFDILDIKKSNDIYEIHLNFRLVKNKNKELPYLIECEEEVKKGKIIVDLSKVDPVYRLKI
ncbi:MAG: hypothetical protein QXF12_00275 [Candidatus Aenigmatarchaeota archaeon]